MRRPWFWVTLFCLHLQLKSIEASSCSGALGVEDGTVDMTQVTVSSDTSGYRKARIRLNTVGRAWKARHLNTDQWALFDLLKPVRITTVGLQGLEGAYVTSYHVLKSEDGVTFEYYTESGSVVLFSTDTSSQAADSDYVDMQSLDMYTRFIKISVQSWVTEIMARVELYGCDDIRSTCSGYEENNHLEGWYTGYPSGDSSNLEEIYCIDVHPERTLDDCYAAMGIEDGSLSASQFSASSVKSGSPVSKARLNANGGEWRADSDDANQWFQIDFADFVTVSRVATQASSGKDVTGFTLDYSFDGTTFYSYYETFTASSGNGVITYNDITIPIRARYLRFLITSWSGSIGMRLETYGCSFGKANQTCSELEEAGEADGWLTNWVYCRPIAGSMQTCADAMGMESGSIPDSSLTASSYKSDSDGYRPEHGRLNVVSDSYSDSCWVTDTTDTNQYLQINLGSPNFVSKVVIQGSPGGTDYWTETFYVQYSDDGSSFTTYQEDGSPKLLTGNTDATTAVTSTFLNPFEAQYIRINPQSWNTYPAIRAEVYGCANPMDDCDTWYSSGYTTPGTYSIALPGWSIASVYCPMDQLTTGVASCKDYQTDGYTTDGYYWIKPSGSTGFAIHCDFDTSEFVNDVILMEVGHDAEDATDVSGTQYAAAGSYSVSLTYECGSPSDLSIVAQSALYCEQQLYYTCEGAYIFNSGVQYTWWEDAAGSQMTSFPGADSSFTGCACGENDNCVAGVSGTPCNCDQTYPYSEARDGGFIVDKSKLPISAFYAGHFVESGDTAEHIIGKLRCFDADTSTIPSSCQDAADSFMHSTNGYYFIDPDGTSSTFQPLKVYCDFTSVENAVATVFEHDYIEVTVEDTYSSAKYAREINYNGASLAQIEELMTGALRCEQYIGFECGYGTRIRKSDRAFWVSRDGTKMEYWGGATENDKCACGMLGTCLDPTEDCQCDIQDTDHVLYDNGYLTDKTKLPVSKLQFGDARYDRTAKVSLGNLRCYHQTSSKLYKSCYHMKVDGVSTDGDYFVDPDGSGSGQDAFMVTCDLSHNDTHAKQTFSHDSENRTHVEGFEDPGTYAKDINYLASWDQFDAHFALTNYQECEQYIKYECRESQLLESDTGYWISRNGETMRYWGGGSPDQLTCACGVDGSCDGGSSDKCNCDDDSSSLATDDGYLYNNTHLPVSQLRLGDTGDSGEEGYFTLGKLVCYITTPPGPCFSRPCKNSGSCDDDDGEAETFTCDCTGTGYTGTTCEDDVDECSTNADDCHSSKATCANTVGSFTCTCISGYTGDGVTCTDVDECSDASDDCVVLSTCTNTVGSYTCDCDSGYEGDGKSSGNGCSDVDECATGTHTCNPSRATCSNTVGSFTCVCSTGYEDADGDGDCDDIDECADGTDDCHSLATCNNVDGSYECECNAGYTGDGTTGGNGCSDVDECSDGSHTCNTQIATCSNTVGWFTCNCKTGFEDADGDNDCEDVNECRDGTDDCHSTLGDCSNNYGSFSCACASGYEGDGISFCSDIDECASNTDNCHSTYGICTNTAGGFDCACKNGFGGNGVICAEINECTGITCTHSGTCVDLIGKYRCDCDFGYWGDDCELSFLYDETVQIFTGSYYWSFDDYLNGTYEDSQSDAAHTAEAGNARENDYGIDGKSVMTAENGTNDCVDFGDFSSTCISEPQYCTSGLAASVWVRFTSDQIKDSGTKYIFSSGPPDSTGFAVYKEPNKFYVVVVNSTYKWEVKVQNQLTADLWQNIGFSWHWRYGLDVAIDAESVGSDASGTLTSTPALVDTLTLGCRYDGADYRDHSAGIFDEFAVWTEYANYTEYNRLMGGLDGDDCVSGPCQYGSCRDVGLASWVCDCMDGYNGTQCEIEIDECASDPCQNGGTCNDQIAMFECECAFGFTGDFCHQDLTPNYDFSNVVDLLPSSLAFNVESNPYYILAPYIWPLATSGGSLDITGSNYTVVTGRGQVGLYIQIGSDDTWVNLGDFTDHCIGLPRDCVDGISVSVWLKLHPKVKDNTPAFVLYSGAANQGGRVGIAVMVTKDNSLLLQVIDGWNEVKSASIPESHVPWGDWFNVAFTWEETNGTNAYINGKRVREAVIVIEPSGDYNSDNVLTIGTQYNSLDSAYPAAYSDLVVWNRHLYRFEAHRFLGMTRREFSLLNKVDHLWTTDAWIRRDHLTISKYDSNYNNSGQLTLPGEGIVLLMPGRDEKGNSLLILGCCDQWLYMGDFADECISNPSKCTNGLSVALWVQLSQVQDNDTHYLISSGEQVTMGFSIYQRGDQIAGNKLGAAVTDGNYRWILEIPYQPHVMEVNTTEGFYELSDWVHLGITWSARLGLHLYINGLQYAVDITGYRKIRPDDYETRLILGRRNDFLDHDSNFTFEELAIFERELEPFEFRDMFGLRDNINYNDADYYWDTQGLITSDYFILADHAVNQSEASIGPNENTVVVDDDTIELVDQQSDILLGDFNGTCISDPSLCYRGITVSLWFNYAYANSGTQYILSSGAQATSTGFVVLKQGSTLKFIVDDGSNIWTVGFSLSDVPNGEWCNLAFTWHKDIGLTVYLNGASLTPTSQTITGSSSLDDFSLLVLGRRNDMETQYGDFKIHNLVIWEKYTYSKNVHRLFGISAVEKYHYDKSDYYWPFDTPAKLINPTVFSTDGISYTSDRHSVGKAVCTDGSKGYIQLGNIPCLSNPSFCTNGFAVALWMKLKDIPSDQGYLISVGAQEEDEIGFVVVQKPSYIDVIVGDGTYQWQVEVAQELFSFKHWEYFAFIWSPNDGLTVSINGTVVANQESGVRNKVRTNDRYNKMTLGRSNSENDDFILACYDDIIVILPDANTQLPEAEELYGDPGCPGYLTSDQVFNVTDGNTDVGTYSTQLVTDRNDVSQGAVETVSASGQHGYIGVALGNATTTCLNDPSLCTNGITMSLWLKPRNFANLQDSNTNPDGYGYIISTGPSGGKGFILKATRNQINFVVNDGLTEWDAEVSIRLSKDWTNIALTWDPYTGPRILLDGIEPATTVSTNPNDTSTSAPHSYTDIHIGKRIDDDSGYYHAVYDDLVVWYEVLEFSDPNIPSIVYGDDCREVLVTTNHAELDALSVWTGTIECDNEHAAGCSRDLDELYEMIAGDGVLDETAYQIVVQKLHAYAQPRTYMTLDELEVSVEVFNKLLHHTLPKTLNETEALDDLQTVLEISSSLLIGHRQTKWKSVHQSHPGATMMMKDLESYFMDVVSRMRDEDGKKGDLNITLATENLIMQTSRFDISSYDPDVQFTFPFYGDARLGDIDEEWSAPSDTITLPKNVFDFTTSTDGKATVVAFLYETMDEVLPSYSGDESVDSDNSQVNSRLMSLALDPPLREDLYNPVVIVLQNSEERTSSEETVCTFWDYDMEDTINGGWNTTGCKLHSSTSTETICYCYHLTQFSSLKQPKNTEGETKHDKILRFISWTGLVISMLALIILLVIYVGFRPMRRVHHMIHVNLIVAMLVAKFCSMIVMLIQNKMDACKTMAVFLHYFYTASFTWMLVDGIHLLVEIKVTLGIWFRERLRYYLLIGWGLPAMIVGISLAITIEGYGSTTSCLFSIKDGAIWGFIAPCALIIIANVWILITVVRNTGDEEIIKKADKLDSRKSSLRASAILLPLLGVTWIFGALYIGEGHIVLRYFFVILNSLQGIFVFLLHGLGSQEVRVVGKALIGRKNVEKEFVSVLRKMALPKEQREEKEKAPQPIKPAYMG